MKNEWIARREKQKPFPEEASDFLGAVLLSSWDLFLYMVSLRAEELVQKMYSLFAFES